MLPTPQKENFIPVDFKKAFDSIWHQGLLYKLLKYNIGGTSLNNFQHVSLFNMLCERQLYSIRIFQL